MGFLVIISLSTVGASSANISHSYDSTSSISNGSIVSLEPNRPSYVQLANTGNGQRLLGVAVNSKDSLLAVDATPGDVQVAISGTANVLVSNLNGSINIGDPIAVSPFNGVGMKAIPGSYDIGLAQTSFNGNSQGAISRRIISKNGTVSQVQIGYIRLSIAIGIDASSGSQSPTNILQKIVKSLTGRTISLVRIIITMVVAITTIVTLVTLVYASIYGSIISVGRNPLARYAIFRALGSVLAMAILLTVVAGLTIFLLLR